MRPEGVGAAPPLARATLDRAAHHRRDPDWLATAWRRARVLVVDIAGGGRALVRSVDPEGPAAGPDEAAVGSDGSVDARLVLLTADTAPQEGDRLFLGVEPDGVPVFMVDGPLPTVDDTRAANLRDSGHRLSDRDAGILTAATALGNWHATHRFSPASGRPTTITDGGWARVDESGVLMFPRTDPAMIVLVHDGVDGPGGRCLLGHNAAWGARGGARRFSCLAGYVEPGESAEAAVVRETAEEVGVQVSALRYEASQSWPYPGSLMLGFTAVADPARPLRLDPDEIAEACWFTRRDIAAMIEGDCVHPESGVAISLPMRSSIAFYLIERWLTAGRP
ncbi:MAG TPA: NAD(+) diphosphatase [Actinoplanes sp.]|nr:NAD(+) diphosphatase [Actinoplanes sp.]